MRILFIIVIVASLIGLSFNSKTKMTDKRKESRSVNGSYAPVVVLELFTSEGCSSCPPADNLLPQLAKLDSNVIPLSFHVDYWNHLGWQDPFSSTEFSERQRQYGEQFHLESVYTPELVVNGEYELVGSNRGEAESAIKKVLQEKTRVQLIINDVKLIAGKLQFTIHAAGDLAKTDLLAALVQKQATMNVKAGENSGARLSHINVVRSFVKQTTAEKTSFTLEMPVKLAQDGWRLIVYAQQKSDLKITGAVLYNPPN
jgi:hypothetical protein